MAIPTRRPFFLSGFCLGQQVSQRFSLATRLVRCSFAFCLIWLLASCTAMRPAPEDNPPVAAAVQIALVYEQDGDLTRAQESLQALAVANPHLWLLMVAEEQIAQDAGAETTKSLVRLTLALDLASASIQEYAEQHGLWGERGVESPMAALSPEEGAVVTGQTAAEQAADAQVNDQESSNAVDDQPEPTQSATDADANIN